jgi:DNA-binding MarR family transcriptional regulator
MSNNARAGPANRTPAPEPDPFSTEELAAWRGMLRVHSAVFRELDRRLIANHRLSADAYGVLITLVGASGQQLPIGELGERRNLSPSGISRSIDRLTKAGLVERIINSADRRSLLVALTDQGLARLREAQVTHHATVRELLFANLTPHDVGHLGKLWEKAMPGAVSSDRWPPDPHPPPESRAHATGTTSRRQPK